MMNREVYKGRSDQGIFNARIYLVRLRETALSQPISSSSHDLNKVAPGFKSDMLLPCQPVQ
jgi:hypothetical protein